MMIMEKAMAIIEELKTKYSGDDEAMEIINGAIEDIKYITQKEKEGNYDGQTVLGRALEVKETLGTWF